MSQSPTARQDRIRVSQACDNCRDKKSKCDGVKSVCGRCQLKSLECHYGMSKRIKNQQVMKELATKVAQYESMLKRTIPAQQRPYEQSMAAPLVLDTTYRPTSTEPASATPTTTTTNDSSFSHNTVASSSSQSRRPSEFTTPLESVPNTDSGVWRQTVLDGISLPPQSLMEQAVKAFLEGSALLFTYFDEKEIPTLFEDVYDTTSGTPSKIATIQLCAMAAVGCQYFPERFEDATRVSLISTVKLHIDECIEQEPLPAMRILVMMAMYFTFEKKTAALMYVDMGLRMAKMNRTKTMLFEQSPTQWQRVFGSLIFFDCWLCSTTGHLPSSQTYELYSSMAMLRASNASLAVRVQSEMIRIAIMSSSILQDVYHARYVSTVTITSYKNQLQQWLLSLPDYMRLDFLLSLDNSNQYLRPVFIVHLLYMSTVILVYRRVVVELAHLGNKWSDPEVFHQTLEFLEPCLWTGRQVSRILEIVLSQGQVLQKCWMFIYATYSTCNVLLYFVACRSAHSKWSEDLERDMEAAGQCIKVLKYCAERDEAAQKYLASTSTIYNKIAQVHLAMKSANPEEPDSKLSELLHRLASLSAAFLIHPFDGGFRREVRNLQQTVVEFSDKNLGEPMDTIAQLDTAMLSPGPMDEVEDDTAHVFLSDLFHDKKKSTPGGDRGKERASSEFSETLSLLSTKGILFGS